MPHISGKYIKNASGYRFYVPDPLPPRITWGNDIMNTLSSADMFLGKLVGEGARFANPHIFIRPFITREAVLSSRIEGTQATLSDVLAAQAGAEVKTEAVDLKEVDNYIIALDYGIHRIKTLPLSLRLIREIHEKLMSDVRGKNATPGQFRTSQNWIGIAGCTLTTAAYIPPAPEYMKECLGDLEHFFHDRMLPPLIQAALIHYQFEAIHPFLDGNGRIGRLLITLFLIERGVLRTPLLYLSAFFEATRREYYDRLAAVTQQGAWEAWLHYFLNGVSRQAEDTLMRAVSINKILEDWREQTLIFSSPVPRRLIDLLSANPFITIKQAAAATDVSFTTVQRALVKLEDAGIVQEISGGKRNRVYCAKRILAILDAPAKITA